MGFTEAFLNRTGRTATERLDPTRLADSTSGPCLQVACLWCPKRSRQRHSLGALLDWREDGACACHREARAIHGPQDMGVVAIFRPGAWPTCSDARQGPLWRFTCEFGAWHPSDGRGAPPSRFKSRSLRAGAVLPLNELKDGVVGRSGGLRSRP